MRSGRGDEDLEREVAVELLERRQRVGAQRRLLATRFDDRADERAELVAPRQAVVADAGVATIGTDRDGRKAREAIRLLLDAAGHAVAELGEALAHTDHLRAEVDVAGPRAGRLLRPDGHEELDRPLQFGEPLAYVCLFVSPQKGHTSEPIRVSQRHGSATARPERPGDLPTR